MRLAAEPPLFGMAAAAAAPWMQCQKREQPFNTTHSTCLATQGSTSFIDALVLRPALRLYYDFTIFPHSPTVSFSARAAALAYNAFQHLALTDSSMQTNDEKTTLHAV